MTNEIVHPSTIKWLDYFFSSTMYIYFDTLKKERHKIHKMIHVQLYMYVWTTKVIFNLINQKQTYNAMIKRPVTRFSKRIERGCSFSWDSVMAVNFSLFFLFWHLMNYQLWSVQKSQYKIFLLHLFCWKFEILKLNSLKSLHVSFSRINLISQFWNLWH